MVGRKRCVSFSTSTKNKQYVTLNRKVFNNAVSLFSNSSAGSMLSPVVDHHSDYVTGQSSWIWLRKDTYTFLLVVEIMYLIWVLWHTCIFSSLLALKADEHRIHSFHFRVAPCGSAIWLSYLVVFLAPSFLFWLLVCTMPMFRWWIMELVSVDFRFKYFMFLSVTILYVISTFSMIILFIWSIMFKEL